MRGKDRLTAFGIGLSMTLFEEKKPQGAARFVYRQPFGEFGLGEAKLCLRSDASKSVDLKLRWQDCHVKLLSALGLKATSDDKSEAKLVINLLKFKFDEKDAEYRLQSLFGFQELAFTSHIGKSYLSVS